MRASLRAFYNHKLVARLKYITVVKNYSVLFLKNEKNTKSNEAEAVVKHFSCLRHFELYFIPV